MMVDAVTSGSIQACVTQDIDQDAEPRGEG